MDPSFNCPIALRQHLARRVVAKPLNGAGTATAPLHGGKAIDRLRAATGEQHRAIESLMRMNNGFSIAHYGRALQGFESFLTQWEPLLTSALPASLHTWAEGLRRLPLARRDMAALDLPPLASVALHLALPDKAAALGSMYVLEGSTLGGVVIAGLLRKQHGIGVHNGGAYFSGWGAATAANWLRFREVLEAQIGPDDAARERAATAAVDTFSALNQTLRRSFHAGVDC